MTCDLPDTYAAEALVSPVSILLGPALSVLIRYQPFLPDCRNIRADLFLSAEYRFEVSNDILYRLITLLY